MPAPVGRVYRHGMRTLRLTVLIAVLAAAGSLAAGCDLRFNYLNDGFTKPDRITEVQLERGGSGDVEVRGDDTVTGVEVRRTVRYRGGTAPAETARVEGARLTLNLDCGSNCSVSYQVRLPKGASVTGATSSGDVALSGVGTVDVEVSSGDIELKDANGAAKLSASSGTIVVRGLDGDLTAKTSSGDIDASGLAAATIRAEATSGDVTLEAAGGTIAVETGSGDIELRVPDNACRVTADAGSGRVTVRVTESTTGTCRVDAHAGSGDVSVDPR